MPRVSDAGIQLRVPLLFTFKLREILDPLNLCDATSTGPLRRNGRKEWELRLAKRTDAYGAPS